MNEKAQSALEYLMTYGWALVVIVIIIGILGYLGLFNLGGNIELCTGFPSKFVYKSHIYRVDGNFGLTFSNILSHKIQVTKVKDVSANIEKTLNPATLFIAGDENTVTAILKSGKEGLTYKNEIQLTFDEFGDDAVTIAQSNRVMSITCNGKYN